MGIPITRNRAHWMTQMSAWLECDLLLHNSQHGGSERKNPLVYGLTQSGLNFLNPLFIIKVVVYLV